MPGIFIYRLYAFHLPITNIEITIALQIYNAVINESTKFNRLARKTIVQLIRSSNERCVLLYGLTPLSIHHRSFQKRSSQPILLRSTTQHPNYGDCLEVKREYYQNSSVLDCVTQCSQSAAHLYEQFLQLKQIGFVTLGPLRCV